MPRFALGSGGGGGGTGGAGLTLGPETNEFTSIAARDNYGTANADWLAEYDANSAFLVSVTVSGTTTYYRRSGSAWETVTSIIQGGKGEKGDTGDADEYFVLPASVAQTNANKDITLTITGVTAYAAGQEAIFHTKTGTNGTANCRLQINALGLKRLLKEDGTEFETNELEPDTQIRAIYDGTDFLSDFARRSQVHYLEIADVTRVGDAYSVTDTTIPGTGTATPIFIGLKSEADNVGNVTLSVNSSTAYSVLKADGSQIPPGGFPSGEVVLLVFNTIGTVGWHATNLRPSPDIAGQLIATATYTVGTWYPNESAQANWPTWVLDANAPTGVSVDSNIQLSLGVPKRYVDHQIGWFFQCKLDGTVFSEGGMLLDNLETFRVLIPPTEYMSTNERSDIRLTPGKGSLNEDFLILNTSQNNIVIAANDPVITFEVRYLIG